MDAAETGRGAVLVIKRRTWIQDAVRAYKVIVDDAVIAMIGPFQTKSFPLVVPSISTVV
jgi:hypothetical protein